MIKYIGSKRRLLDQILAVVQQLASRGRVIDLFSGTARVGHRLKAHGYQVFANDHNAYAATLARCYVQADDGAVAVAAQRVIDELNRLRGRAGWFTATYCEQARFFQPHNGARIEAIRDRIDHLALDDELRAVVLVSLMEAADRVDSTTGLQMAYLKQWAPRSFDDLQLRLPALLPRAASGVGRAFELDALDMLAAHEADVVYLDPPYNQHSYLRNYHIWETLVRWDRPETYGVARKRTDCRTRRSDFNSRPRSAAALGALVAAANARALVVSFNDEGYLPRGELEAMLATRGPVRVFEHDCKRYVGAQIGIHNPQGERVGRVSHLRNKELIYVVAPLTATAAAPVRNRSRAPSRA